MRLLVVVVVLALLVGVVKLLPWWITVGLLVVAFLVRGRILEAVFTGAAKGLFDTKSRVLRGASAQVHGVRRVEVPEDLATEGDDAARLRALRWFELDVTIAPDPSQARQMTHWDPFDLELVDAALPARTMEEDDPAEDASKHADVHAVRQEVGGERHEIDDKLTGPARLVLSVGVPAGFVRAKLRYYFEDFGDVVLPAD